MYLEHYLDSTTPSDIDTFVHQTCALVGKNFFGTCNMYYILCVLLCISVNGIKFDLEAFDITDLNPLVEGFVPTCNCATAHIMSLCK